MAGLYTHYAFAFVMLVQGTLFLLWVGADLWRSSASTENWEEKAAIASGRNRDYVWYYGIANLLTVLLYSPWITTAWRQIST